MKDREENKWNEYEKKNDHTEKKRYLQNDGEWKTEGERDFEL